MKDLAAHRGRLFLALGVAVALPLAIAIFVFGVWPHSTPRPALEMLSRRISPEDVKKQLEKSMRPKPEAANPVLSPVPDSSKGLPPIPGEYNRPGTLFLGTSTPVQFVLQTEKDVQNSEEMFKDFPGTHVTTTVKISDTVSAYLTGPKDMLEINLRGHAIRTVVGDEPVSWIWDVRPLKPGQAEVEVFSHIKLQDEERRVQIRVLQDTWTMEAKGLEWLKYQISEIEPIQAFLWTIVSGGAGVLAFFGFKASRSRRKPA